MKFMWRLAFIPTALLTVTVCIVLSSQLFTANKKVEQENEDFSYLIDGMKFSSHVLNSTVHLAFVVDNVTSAITLMKSVLIHRRSPVHFHFMVAHQPFQKTIDTLLGSWEIPDVTYTCYSISELKKNTSWLPSDSYYGAINDVVKFHLPYLLPPTLNRVIVLDSQLIMIQNVWEVWNLFLQSEIRNKPITISRTNSLDNQHFDGAIIFYNLDVVRSIEWKRIWHRAAQKVHNPLHSFVTRRIVNSIIAEFPSIHSLLPCKLVEHCGSATATSPMSCHDFYHNLTKTYFVLLRGLRKSDCREEHVAHYHAAEKYVNMYNSISLKSNYQSIKAHSELRRLSRGRICRLLREDSHMKYITRLFHTGGLYKPINQYETTVVTQLSIDRLEMFARLLKHWTGPASITLYGNDTQVWQVIEFLSRSGLVQRNNLAVHFVLKQGKFYPVNYLRNVALSSVKTDYVFLDDADFLPSFGIHERLQVYNEHLLSTKPKRALVIPAFQTVHANLTYPLTKEALLKDLNISKVTSFCPTCKHQTHAPTRYNQWYNSFYPYAIDWALHFEPYVVVKSDVVPYNRAFMGYGWNKVSQITELKAQGYEFIVVPDHFIIHMPHKSSKDKVIWFRGAFKYCIDRIWKKFVGEVKRKYGDNCLTEKHGTTTVFKNFEI